MLQKDIRATWEAFLSNTGYSSRPQQEELVDAISEALDTANGEGTGILIGRAGTGTGKSFASVVPALAYRTHIKSREPVIVSTATKGLQGQYAKKDLPQIQKAYPQPIKFAILKGRSNYVCQQKLTQPEALANDPQALKRAKASTDGDIADIRPLPHARQHFIMPQDDCPGARKCPFGATCFFEKAKQKAQEADVVIVNHALVATDAAIRHKTKGGVSILPNASVLVLDEAHKFEGYAQNAFSWAISRSRLYREGNNLLDGPDSYEWQQEVDKFFKLVRFDRTDKRNPKQQMFNRDNFQHGEDGEPSPFEPILLNLLNHMADASKEWMREANQGNDKAWQMVRKAEKLIEQFEVMLPASVTENDNFWMELTKADEVLLCYRPLDVSEFLRENLWSGPPAVLLSATPPHDPKGNLGIDEHDPFDCDSPFDYEENTLLYISPLNGKPPFDRTEKMLWEQKRHQEMLSLVAAADGRALLLFTSWVDLYAAHKALAPALSKAGVTVLKQDADNEAARTELARQFKEDERSVLFGTQSFFEGIDVPGKACQLVIISKLPFPAMIDVTRGGQLDFGTEMLPEMRQHLVQAAGRLIRTTEDKGVVAVIDCRLRNLGYGRNILANLAPFNDMPKTQRLQEAMDYLESIDPEEA
jgi:ATP-dependent DNA helicase DinG